jgi:DNA-binding NarL/FixJ family response regulator
MESKNSKFSETELAILSMTAQGYSNKTIAQKLYLSYHTVKAHLAKIFKKLNANDRTHAIYIATSKEIIEKIQ